MSKRVSISMRLPGLGEIRKIKVSSKDGMKRPINFRMSATLYKILPFNPGVFWADAMPVPIIMGLIKKEILDNFDNA